MAATPPLVRRGDAGDPLHALRPPRQHAPPRLVEAARALGDVLVGQTSLGHDGVQDAECQGEVGAGRRLEVQTGELRGGCAPGVDHDQAARADAVAQVLDERRHGLRGVGADEQDRVRRRQVGDRERQAPVHAERPQRRRRGRRHAEAAVVVDVRGTEGDPGELAEQITLLVGQTTAAEDAHRVRAVLAANRGEPRGDQVQRLVPARRAQPAAVADHRGRQPGG
jgi:hypothetical protein